MAEGAERAKSRWRPLRLGCLGLLLGLCAGVGWLVAALPSGPVEWRLPGGTTATLGSDHFVLSNFSFQNGTTYYFDMDGNGVRNIVEVRYLEESGRVQLVLRHSEHGQRVEQELLGLKLP